MGARAAAATARVRPWRRRAGFNGRACNRDQRRQRLARIQGGGGGGGAAQAAGHGQLHPLPPMPPPRARRRRAAALLCAALQSKMCAPVSQEPRPPRFSRVGDHFPLRVSARWLAGGGGARAAPWRRRACGPPGCRLLRARCPPTTDAPLFSLLLLLVV